METIHLKTVDPVSQELLRTAAQKGIQLNWERYERLQPADGFLRLGLSCPYGCLQGPCRIDPFGRGSDRGVCGLDRDGMVAAFLLRLTLQGVLELTNTLPSETDSAMPIREIFQSAAMLDRPSASSERLIRQSLLLARLAVEFLKPAAVSSDNLPCETGYGLLAHDLPVIGVTGQPAMEFVQALVQGVDRQPLPAVVVSLGEWIASQRQFLPLACTSGEAELLASAGAISLLIAGERSDFGLIQTAKELKIPVLSADDRPGIEEILRLANGYHSTHSRRDFAPESSLKGQANVHRTEDRLSQALKTSAGARFALVGGFDTPQQPLGWIPVELAKALKGTDHQVAAWGDAALWMIKDGLASAEQTLPVQVLDPWRGPVQGVEVLGAAGLLDRLSGVCFTGLKGCRELAVALGLAAGGVKVTVATPLPLWGSEGVRSLLTEKLAERGGRLIHFDHPAQAAEVLDAFTA